MGMMAKMRSLAPWFIITVGGLFVLFMVLSDSKVTQIMGQRSRYVGSINDYDVTYQEFSNFVEQARQNSQAQSGKDIDESQMDQFRDQVWQALVNRKLMEQKIDEFGISVTDDEIRDVILSDNPPQFLKQSFIDSTGNFNRELYMQAIMDTRNKDALVQAEDAVRADLLQKKLENYLFSTVMVSEDELKNKFMDDNIRMTADYALVSTNIFVDSLAKVSDEEVRNYYDENKSDYKTEAKRKVKYVLFRKAPSKNDSIGVIKNLESIVKKLKSDTSSFKTYVEIYSDNPFSKDTVSISRLPRESQVIIDAKVGDIIGPILTFEGATVLRYVDRIKSKTPSVKASHILIKTVEGKEKASKAVADSIYRALKRGADFAKTARELSEDPGSAVKGGDLGWFGKGQMVKPFEKACFNGRVGVIQRPVKTRFGYHIIKVTGKSKYDFVIEKIVNKIKASATTVDKLYNDAADFSYLSKEDGFNETAEMLKYNVLETPGFDEKATNIPGVGTSSAILHFSFDNGVGDISDAFKVQAGYAVVMVSEEIDKGYQPFDGAKDQIKRKLVREKKEQLALDKMKELKPIAEKVGNFGSLGGIFAKVKVGTAPNFTSGSSIPQIGRDYAFANYCLNGELNAISEPIKGNQGAFLIKLTSRTAFDSTSYAIQKNTIRENILRTKKSQFLNNWILSIRDNADIVDNRYQFYR